MTLPRFRIQTLMIAVAVVATAFGVAVIALRPMSRHLYVQNLSGQSIPRLKVVVGSLHIIFLDIPDGATVSAVFPTRGVDDFTITGTTAGGTPLSALFGFNPGPMSEDPAFLVDKGGRIRMAVRRTTARRLVGPTPE